MAYWGDYMTIIYNKSNGNVILMMSEKIEAVSSVMSDIPDGYIVSSVNRLEALENVH